MAFPLMRLKLVPVVAAEHPLVHLRRTLGRADLEPYVQLILSDTLGPDGPNHGIVGNRVWRFFDQTRRLHFLLSGFGWCKMPPYLAEPYLKKRAFNKVKNRGRKLVANGDASDLCSSSAE